MKKELLLGDEALAKGAIRAGISGVYGYPGTPSTEIFESIKIFDSKKTIHARWSTNEKTAYEEALGMSFAGKRALITMKHVGLNVAADAFMNSAITGVNGGLVLAVADDPGMHSSQNEQDSRYFADFAQVPVLEPHDQQEAYEMAFEAFDLSEKLNVPVMLRIVTRLAHSRAVVETVEDATPQKNLNPSEDISKWTLIPSYARKNYSRLAEAQKDFLRESETSKYNILQLENTEKAILVAGLAENYVMENLDENQKDYSILSIRQYPAPTKLIRKLVDGADDILVVEDGYPFLETRLRGFMGLEDKKIRGKLSGDLPRTGELNPDLLRSALGLPARETILASESLAQRPPQLCMGCPHSFALSVLSEVMKKFPSGDVFGDIGCYALGALPPLNAIHTCVDMGASISMSAGAAHAGIHPSVAAIGDSTFGHSGMTPLRDAAIENTAMTVIILDNSTVAMTGGQNSSASGDALCEMVEGLGVPKKHIALIEPLPKNEEENLKVVAKELEYKGLSVIISQRVCLETARKERRAVKK